MTGFVVQGHIFHVQYHSKVVTICIYLFTVFERSLTIYLIKNTVKAVILWSITIPQFYSNIFTIVIYSFYLLLNSCAAWYFY